MVRAISCPDCYSGALRSIPAGQVEVGFIDNKVALGKGFFRVIRLTLINVIPIIPTAHWDVKLVSLKVGPEAMENIRSLSGPQTRILASYSLVVLLTSHATEQFKI